MKGKILLLTASIFLLFLVLPNLSLAASCCVIRDNPCTYWDMGDWNKSQEFCNKFELALNITTDYYSQLCTDLSVNTTGCTSGFSYVICGDGKCESLESCSSCSADCGVCPPSGGGGGGGYFCGDKICNGKETCSTCPIDCGACAPLGGAGNQTGQQEGTQGQNNQTTTGGITGTTGQGGAGITGGVIGTLKRPAILVPLIFTVLIVGLALYFNFRKKSGSKSD